MVELVLDEDQSMNTKPLLVLSAVIAMCLAGCATTEESMSTAPETEGAETTASATMSPAQPIDAGQSFTDLDTNKDGSLSKDEVASNEMLTKHYSMVDTDGSGSLSQAEVDAHRASMASKPH